MQAQTRKKRWDLCFCGASAVLHFTHPPTVQKRLPTHHKLELATCGTKDHHHSLPPPSMAALDFANMTKQDLSRLRRHTIRAGERPSAENNYFATTFSAGVSNKRPTDYIPTALFTAWCEHHGPLNHVTAECRDGNGVTTKPPASQLVAEEKARRMAQFGKYVITPTVAYDPWRELKMVSARQGPRRNSNQTSSGEAGGEAQANE